MRTETYLASAQSAGAFSRLTEIRTPDAAHRSPEIGPSSGWLPSGGWPGSTTPEPAGGGASDCAADGAAEPGPVLGLPSPVGLIGGPIAAPLWVTAVFGPVPVFGSALRTSAPARVAVASTPTASAMPTKRSGPPG